MVRQSGHVNRRSPEELAKIRAEREARKQQMRDRRAAAQRNKGSSYSSRSFDPRSVQGAAEKKKKEEEAGGGGTTGGNTGGNTNPDPVVDQNQQLNDGATDKQKAFLDSLGAQYDPNITKREASSLLSQLIDQQEQEEQQTGPKLATDAQKQYLLSLGVTNFSSNMTISEASKLISEAVDARDAGQNINPFEEAETDTGIEEEIIQEGQEEIVEKKEFTRSERRKIIQKHFGLSSRERRDVERLFEMAEEKGIPKWNLEELIEGTVNNRQGALEYMEFLFDPRVNSPTEFTENDLVVTQEGKEEIKVNWFKVIRDATGILGSPGSDIRRIMTTGSAARLIATGELTPEQRQEHVKNFGIGLAVTAGVGLVAGGLAYLAVGGGATVSAGTMVAAQSGLRVATFASLKKILTKPAVKLAGKVAGVDVIMAWLASDNILSGSSMYIRDLKDAVIWDGLSKSEARMLVDQQEQIVKYAENFVKVSTILNPFLWPFRKVILSNVETTKNSLELAKQYFEE